MGATPLMARSIAALLLAAPALGGCVAPHLAGPLNGYSCQIERSDARGKLVLDQQLGLDGTPDGWRGSWTLRSGPTGLQAYLGRKVEGKYIGVPQLINWNGSWTISADGARLDSYLGGDASAMQAGDPTLLSVGLFRARGGPGLQTRGMTIELRREGETAVALSLPVNGYDSLSYSAGTTIGSLRDAAGGHRLDAVAVDRRGRMLVRGSFDPAALDGAIAMADAARGEMEAMRADFRKRCIPTQGLAPGEPSPVIT
jgi:hypothetical protein